MWKVFPFIIQTQLSFLLNTGYEATCAQIVSSVLNSFVRITATPSVSVKSADTVQTNACRREDGGHVVLLSLARGHIEGFKPTTLHYLSVPHELFMNRNTVTYSVGAGRAALPC